MGIACGVFHGLRRPLGRYPYPSPATVGSHPTRPTGQQHQGRRFAHPRCEDRQPPRGVPLDDFNVENESFITLNYRKIINAQKEKY